MTNINKIEGYKENIEEIKLSIIIPVYNAEEFLEESLKSVLSQTLDEIEIICVDDGSTDNSLKILNEFAKKNKNFTVISQKNQYAAIARNNGLKLAKGEYVYFFDCDDLLYDDKVLENMYNSASTNNIDVLRGKSVTLDNETKEIASNPYFSLSNIPKQYFNKVLNLNEHYNIIHTCSDTPWSGICRREFLVENYITFPNIVSCEDANFFVETILKCKSFYILDINIVKYRVNNSKSFVFARFANFEHLIKSFNIIESLCKDYPLNISSFIVSSRLSTLLSWLYKGSSNEYHQKNIELCKEFFENYHYSYWGGKEKCPTYIEFYNYYNKNNTINSGTTIRISQIDDKFSIYKDNVVVLLGIGNGTKQLLDLINYHKIEVSYICDINTENWGKVLEGITVISPQQLQKLAISNSGYNSKGVVVQISVNNIQNEIEKQLLSIGVKNVISFKEAFQVLKFINKFNLVKANDHLLPYYENYLVDKRSLEEKNNFIDYILNNYDINEYLFICSIPKTGDNTLINTFNSNNIKHHMMHHTADGFDKKLLRNMDKKVKIIVGIRELISQNISVLYQDFDNFNTIFSSFLLRSSKSNIFENGGDAQEFFDIRFDNYDDVENKDCGKFYQINLTNDFMNNLKENAIDLSKYPFDQKKGYSIIKEGNIEVFMYQLEKMNDIVKEMSDWIGQTPFDKWVMGNEASSKWIADSYKQAQKEIKFSQEYFDRCYNDPWVQHFYSQEDIEKFKERWRPHIKE